MSNFRNLKLAALGAVILVGLAIQGTIAEAKSVQRLVVAGGCFWCVESDFESVSGVIEATSGYTGGTTKNPTYKQVGKNNTGHYEAVEILFDADRVSADTLLNMFFRSIDPTDAGGQFCDRGSSYRSAVFYGNSAQKSAASKAKSDAQAALGKKIVTPILPLNTFYKAEDYHQDYYKGSNTVLTRFGPIKQSKAYKKYRSSCGRDARVKRLWGSAAAFAK